ncbi:MAG TPA: SRPBCC family protein [Gaiellaceae bacterium]|nr:SRPBCC family protein [Gaiellaceae bacterium]
MAPIVASVEISRRPEDVFAYITDPSHLPEWQESVVRVKTDASAPTGGGSRALITRRVGRREMDMTADITDLDPPKSWRVWGVDGPVRGNVKGTIEPLDDGARSRVTLELDIEGHGIGKLLVPLVVRRQAQKELPINVQNLKERLESAAV